MSRMAHKSGFFLLELGIALIGIIVLVSVYSQVYIYCISGEQSACRRVHAVLAAESYANQISSRHELPQSGDSVHGNYRITAHVALQDSLENFRQLELILQEKDLTHKPVSLLTGIVI